MLDWQIRMARKVRPWMVATAMAAGFVTACPAYYGPAPAYQEPPATVYGPAYNPSPPCLSEVDCGAADSGWICDAPPPGPDGEPAWGRCVRPEPETAP